jgi:fibronectin-binding autotransporter adhesin
MKRAYIHGLGALFLGISLATATAQTVVYTWSGLGTGWQGQVTPLNDGNAIFYLPKTINEGIPLSGNFSLNSILLATGTSTDTYTISAAASLTLTINDGIIGTGTGFGRLYFDPNINIAGNGTLVFNAANSSIIIPGQITGSAALGLVSSNVADTNGAFIFNNTGAGNTYSGNTSIGGVTGSKVTVAFWNGSPFGTGTLDVFGSSEFIAHNTLNVTNAITFSTVTPNDPIYFKSWDAPLTLSGPVTLSANTSLNARVSQHGYPSADGTGIYLTPGPASRNPIVFTGAIMESGSHSLTVGGLGVVVLEPASGNNTYTGGTSVSGSLVFGNSNAIPAVGSINVTPAGYAGIVDTTPGNFAAFLSHVSSTSTGAVGVDTLNPNFPAVLNDNINLSSFPNTSIRLGTATSAILTGTITPQGTDYQFGNGGGTLYVRSSLPNVSTISNLVLTDGNNAGLTSPLKLYLQTSPSYTGNTRANNGFIIFDGGSLPSGSLIAAGSSGNTGSSYIGLTNSVDVALGTFLTNFDKTNTWGIVGVDTYATYEGTYDWGSIDLSTFNNGVYLGTATRAILSGTITPTADHVLRLTAGNGGTLTVNSTLADGASPLALVFGTPSLAEAYSNGTVILNGANTYTGGTAIDSVGSGITLQVGNSGALGTGALTLPQNVSAGLQASVPSITLPNPIVFQNPVTTNDVPASLFINGSYAFELSGPISGPGSLNLSTQVTLSGNNSALSGDINFVQGTSLVLNNNNAAGTGTLRFNHTSSSLNFGSSAPNPVLYGIDGDNGNINLNTGTVLTFDLSNQNNDTSFGGMIGNEGPVNASLVITASVGGQALYLSGSNNYTGGTTITSYGSVGLGNNQALGTGMVTLNASHGAVALNDGIIFTNPLTFTAGGLMGFGTFAPSNLSTITIDNNKAVIPGLFYISDQSLPGKLTFATNAIFSNGGQYYWSLQDVSRVDGYSQLFINGNLDLTTISTGGFTLDMLTFDATDHLGFANLVIGHPYTFTILTTGGTITGFNAANFSFNTSQFENNLAYFPNLTLTADSNHLYLNFTAVPEPYTWALLATGAGMIAYRRRRA